MACCRYWHGICGPMGARFQLTSRNPADSGWKRTVRRNLWFASELVRILQHFDGEEDSRSSL